MTTSAPPTHPPSTVPWRGGLVLALAVAWGFGVGSAAAIGLALAWRHRTRSPTDHALLLAGAALGVVGLIVALGSFLTLSGASSS